MPWPWRAYKWRVWRGSGRGHFPTSIQTWEWSRSKSHYEQQCFSSYQVIAFFRLSTRRVRFPANLAVIACENSGHLATLRLVSLRNDVWGIDVEIPYWWRVTTQIWGAILIGWRKFLSRQNQSEALRRSGSSHVISMEFQRSFRRRHFAGKYFRKLWVGVWGGEVGAQWPPTPHLLFVTLRRLCLGSSTNVLFLNIGRGRKHLF